MTTEEAQSLVGKVPEEETNLVADEEKSSSPAESAASTLLHPGAGGDGETASCEASNNNVAASHVTFSQFDLTMQIQPPAATHSFGFGSMQLDVKDDEGSRSAAAALDGDRKTNRDPYEYERPEKWGWVVVVASWVVMIPVAGMLASFGTIVKPLTEEFNATKLEAGWIGSLSFGFTVGTCPISTALFTVYGARKVALVGVIGGAASLIVTSFVPILYLFFLTYSFMYGVFANFVYNSAMNLTGQYFPRKHQALATCLASAGISFGVLAINPVANQLVHVLGWRNMLRCMSGGVVVVGVACVATFRPVKTRVQKIQTKIRKATEKGKTDGLIEKVAASNHDLDVEAITESVQYLHTESRISLAAQEIKKNIMNKKVWDFSVCTNPAFILWMLGTLFWSVSFLFPHIFLIDYMETIGIERSSAAWVLTAYGIAEFVGRLLCAFGAGRVRFSLAYVYAASATFSGAAALLTPQGKYLGVMYAYGIAVGINSGILNSLMFVTTMQLFGNERGRHVWGYINVMLALGMVVGPVTAGGIYDMTRSYEVAFYVGGTVFFVCAVDMFLIPFFAKRTLAKQAPEPEVTSYKKAPIVKHGAGAGGVNLQRLAQQHCQDAAAAASAAGETSPGKKSSSPGKRSPGEKSPGKKSKWNGNEMREHLRELNEIRDDEMRRDEMSQRGDGEIAYDETSNAGDDETTQIVSNGDSKVEL